MPMASHFSERSAVLADPRRGETLFCDHQVRQLIADERLDLAADQWDANLDGRLELQPRPFGGRGEKCRAVQRGRRPRDGTLDDGLRLTVDDRPPRLLADETEVAVMELRD